MYKAVAIPMKLRIKIYSSLESINHSLKAPRYLSLCLNYLTKNKAIETLFFITDKNLIDGCFLALYFAHERVTSGIG